MGSLHFPSAAYNGHTCLYFCRKVLLCRRSLLYFSLSYSLHTYLRSVTLAVTLSPFLSVSYPLSLSLFLTFSLPQSLSLSLTSSLSSSLSLFFLTLFLTLSSSLPHSHGHQSILLTVIFILSDIRPIPTSLCRFTFSYQIYTSVACGSGFCLWYVRMSPQNNK